MLNFIPLDNDVKVIEKYLLASPIQFCDITLGEKFMWRNYFQIEYAIVNDTLIMKESSPDYENGFYFPIGADVDGALKEIERYCIAQHIPLTFHCVDRKTSDYLTAFYPISSAESYRDWADYIYLAQDFKTYKGKKFSGQRNHVNKFKKLYPDFSFTVMTKENIPAVKEFISRLWNGEKADELEQAEHAMIFEYIDNMLSLGQVGGFLSVDGKIVGASIGEVSGDTLVVHIEKADTAYNGAYPTLASEFAKAFASDGVTFINREEDCGDEGLRISKMQYHPVEIGEKIVVTVNTLFGRLTSPIKIYSDRLTVEDILPSDAQDYYQLYMDDALNIWWGYDYREDLNGETPSPEYFYNFQNNLKKIKEEYSFAVKENGKMVGELVLHNFNFRGGVEMGYRFFKEYQGKGFATESATALKKFVLQTLKPKMLMTRCFKQNIPSKNLIGRLGFSLWYETDTHFFFKMDLE